MLRGLSFKSGYVRNITTLMTGTALAQAIPIAISPILTRLYSPEEFGVFAFYMAIVSIASVAVTGRYEMAILLPKKDGDAFNVMALAMGLSCVISGLLFLLVVLFNRFLSELLGIPDLSRWLYWVPASTLLVGVYQSLNYWSNRKGHYRRLAASRVTQSGSSALVQLSGGYAGSGATGLVGGQLIGQALSSAVLGWLIYKDDHTKLKKLKKLRLMVMARRYSAFPKYLIAAHGINIASAQMPVILLGMLFTTATAGFYTLTQRAMGAPMSLIAGAIGDVFRQEASYSYVQHGNCKEIYQRTFKRLVVISAPLSILFFFSAPWVFGFVFGPAWRVSGEYAQILTPVLFFGFVVSPLSAMFMIAEKQRLDLAWQVCFFVAAGGSFFIGHFFSSAKVSLAAFSFAYSVMQVVSGLISYRLAAGKSF
ncbi:oligosaccharide flippase family protein [Alcaligenaceae bacterium CGII-47]|nr:oligosaccharide flippase family protein [Alcaligenaceae bacterium CGII-47]